jgi:hypothetical protein
MTPFTLVMAYYENAGMLREQFRHLMGLPQDIQRNLSLIIVDDGSPTAPAFDALEPGQWAELKLTLERVQLWRMGVDVRWNQDACRNIGARHARTSWLLLTDMDHVVPADTWRGVMTTKILKSRAYRFQRINAPAGDPYKPHPNSWAISRGLYWRVGGYDEALAGHYGTDGDFLVRTRREAAVYELPWPLVRYPREVIPDASTTTLTRKSDEDRATITRLIKGRAENPNWKPAHFTFPHEQLL